MRSDDAVVNEKSGITGGAVSEASDTLRRARRPGRADRTSARARHETGCRIRAVRAADVSNEGTARSAAWRLPEAGIVKGLASPLTRTPAAERLKLPAVWRAEPAQRPPAQQANPPGGRNPLSACSRAQRPPAQQAKPTADKQPSRRRSAGSTACPDTSSPRHCHSPTPPASAAACPPAPTY